MEKKDYVPAFCFLEKDSVDILYEKNMTDRHKNDLNNIMTSPNWKNISTRLILDSVDNNVIYIEIKHFYAFFVFVKTNYNRQKLFGQPDQQYCFFHELSNFVISNYTKVWSKHNKFFDELYNKYFNKENLNDNKLLEAKSKVEEIKEIMEQNINTMTERGDKVNNLEDKVEDLAKTATDFNHETKTLATYMWWRKMKMQLLIGSIILVAIGLLVLICVL